MDREKLAEPGFLDCKGVEGVQVKYTWRQLEQEKDHYVFDDVRTDLALARAKGKRLFIQVQDATFDLEFKAVPKYLLDDPAYHGGVAPQATFPDDKPEEAKPYGWVARRWDPAVRERFDKLLVALGAAFDGEIEGINLPETAIDIPDRGPLMPAGYTKVGYRDAVLATMAALKRAFPRSVAIQYANFMPEAGDAPDFLRTLYERAVALHVGMGGPDLLPDKKYQMANSYPLIREFAGRVPMAIAVQDGNLAYVNAKTAKPFTPAEAFAFASDYLHVTYVFWGTQEPYFTRDVLPFLASR